MKDSYWYAIALIMVVFFIYDFFAYAKNHKWLLENGKRSIGMIVYSGKNIDYQFKREDSDYYITQKTSSPFGWIEVGEQFVVVYHPEDLTNHDILFEEPIIPKDRAFKETYAESIKVLWYNRKKVIFYYLVDGKRYKRVQMIYPDKHQIEKNGRYLVKYMVNNPQVAYVFFTDSTKEVRPPLDNVGF